MHFKTALVVFLLFFIIPYDTLSKMATQTSTETPTPFPTNFRISGLDWSPDGTKVAAGIPNGIEILDAATGLMVQILTGATASVNDVDWSPDGTKIAGSSLDSVGVQIWDVSTEQIITTLQHGGDVTSVNWSPDGTKFVASGFDDSVGIFSVVTGQAVGYPKLAGSFLDWSPDGTKIVAASGYGGQIYVADVATEQRIMILDLPVTTESVDWSADGTKIATGSDDGIVRIWDAVTGELLTTLSGHSNLVLSVSWNIDNRILASASSDETVRVWDTLTGDSLEIIQRSNSVQVVAWSPDGTQLAYAGDESIVLVIPAPDLDLVTPTSMLIPTAQGN